MPYRLIAFALIPFLATVDALATDMNARLLSATERFVGTPYTLDPLGEGETGRYDRDPLYRFDAFDCTTFIETAMALAFARNDGRDGDFDLFFHALQSIRYRGGEIGYMTRNHFPEIDWIPNNAKAGFVRDITTEVAGPFGFEIAEALIEKRSWYEHKRLANINVPGLSMDEKHQLLLELRIQGRAFGSELSRLPYLSIDQALFPDGIANNALFARIPGGAIVNIVRPNWDLAATEGTHLNISHQALLLRKNGELYMRHATTGSPRKVVDQKLKDYLRVFIHHSTIKGINILEITR